MRKTTIIIKYSSSPNGYKKKPKTRKEKISELFESEGPMDLFIFFYNME